MKLTTTLAAFAGLTAAAKLSSTQTTTGIASTASPAAKPPPIPEDVNLTDRTECVTLVQVRAGGVSSKILGRRIVDVASSAGASCHGHTALPGPGPDRDFTGLFNDEFEASGGQVRMGNDNGSGSGLGNMKRGKLSISYKSGQNAEEGVDKTISSASSEPTAKVKSGAGFAKDFNIGLLMVGLAGVGAGFMAA